MSAAVPKRSKRYDAKFKQEIVKLVLDGRKSVQEVCQTHELHESSVYNWVREAKRVARMTPDERLAQQEREELERLRRENKELKRERDPVCASLPAAPPRERSDTGDERS